jgi:hypothetical protein
VEANMTREDLLSIFRDVGEFLDWAERRRKAFLIEKKETKRNLEIQHDLQKRDWHKKIDRRNDLKGQWARAGNAPEWDMKTPFLPKDHKSKVDDLFKKLTEAREKVRLAEEAKDDTKAKLDGHPAEWERKFEELESWRLELPGEIKIKEAARLRKLEERGEEMEIRRRKKMGAVSLEDAKTADDPYWREKLQMAKDEEVMKKIYEGSGG